MPISVTMPIIVSILTSMSKINTSKSLKARISYFLLAVKSSYSVELSMKKFITEFWSGWIMHALHLSLICVNLKCWIQFIGMFFHKQGKWKRCWSGSASSLTPSELDLHCFQDMIYYASNFEKVEGAYCFWLVHPSVLPSVASLR